MISISSLSFHSFTRTSIISVSFQTSSPLPACYGIYPYPSAPERHCKTLVVSAFPYRKEADTRLACEKSGPRRWRRRWSPLPSRNVDDRSSALIRLSPTRQLRAAYACLALYPPRLLTEAAAACSVVKKSLIDLRDEDTRMLVQGLLCADLPMPQLCLTTSALVRGDSRKKQAQSTDLMAT